MVRAGVVGAALVVPLGPLLQNPLHLLPLGQLIDQFVEDADFAHQRVFDLLHPHAADDAGDEQSRRVEGRGGREEVAKTGAGGERGRERGVAVPGEPAEDFVHFGPAAALPFGLLHIERVNARDGHGVDAFGLHAASLAHRAQ